MKSLYTLADEHHATGDEAKFSQLVSRLKGLSHEESLLVASAFSNLLSLHNLTEEVANSRRERQQRLGELVGQRHREQQGAKHRQDQREGQCADVHLAQAITSECEFLIFAISLFHNDRVGY